MAASPGPEHRIHGVLNGNQRCGRAGSEPASHPHLLLDLVRGGVKVADGVEKGREGNKGWELLPLGRAWVVVAVVDEGKGDESGDGE